MFDYNKYQQIILDNIDLKKLDYNYNRINRSYTYFGLKEDFYLKSKILNSLNSETGFYEYDNENNITKDVVYESILTMINDTLNKIDSME